MVEERAGLMGSRSAESWASWKAVHSVEMTVAMSVEKGADRMADQMVVRRAGWMAGMMVER